MRLRSYFILLFLALCLTWIYVFYLFHSSSLATLLGLVALCILQLILLILLYRKVIVPMDSIGTGMDLIKEQDFSSRLRRVNQWEADKVIDVFNSMMEQLKNERLRLREQNEFLDLLINASPMGVLVLNYDKEICKLNPAAKKILDIRKEEVVLGKTLAACQAQLRIKLAHLSKNETQTIRLNDGSIYKCTRSSFLDRGFPRSFYLIESLTDELRRAEKKAYEKVIRMIAHEANNTIAGITSTLDTIKESLADEEEQADFCEAMRICIERCYGMSHFITSFADVVKIPRAQLSLSELNPIVISASRLMEQICETKKIRLSLDLDKQFPPLPLDPVLMEQVLLNIIKNSVESIEENGEIRLRTSAKEQALFISDNGKGISDEVAEKLFSPFFSTKPSGQGIGLLFIREVLSQHPCRFSLRTEPDAWTSFSIYFEKQNSSPHF